MKTALPKKVTGANGLVDWLNASLECIQERTPIPTPDCDIDFTSKGFRIKPKPPGANPGSGKTSQFAVLREYKDYVVGVRATANLTADTLGRTFTLDTEEVYIAKPFELRASPWDYVSRGGLLIGAVDGYLYTYSSTEIGTRTRTLVDGSEFLAESIVWNERIYPPYLFTTTPTTQPDKRIIYATRVEQGTLFNADEDGTPVQWLDANDDGRYWRAEEQKIKVCTGNSGNWFALFPASTAFQES